MDLVNIKKLTKFSCGEIQKAFPSFKQLILGKATRGDQPADSFILGHLKSYTEKVTFIDRENVIKLDYDEISGEGTHLKFEAIFFGEYADAIDEHLKKESDANDIWTVFCNAKIIPYTGTEKVWSPYTLKIRANNDNMVTMFHLKKQFSLAPYSPLNSIKHGGRSDVFVVVREVIKNTTVLSNGNRHTIIAVVDPSCLSDSAVMPDLLLHIFFNDARDRFPEAIEPEDILRIRSVLGDFYKKENRIHGKIYCSSAVVKFKYSEDDDVFHPVTSNHKYVMTESDEKLARNFMHWWSEVREDVQESRLINASQEEGNVIQLKKIEDVTEAGLFNLICMVTYIKAVETCEVVLLRVKDGTRSNVLTSMVYLSQATSDFLSQTENAVRNASEIDVSVSGKIRNRAIKLEIGSVVYLTRVSANLISDGNGNEVFEFFMTEESDSSIIQPYNTCNRARQLRRTLQEEASSGTVAPTQRGTSPIQNSNVCGQKSPVKSVTQISSTSPDKSAGSNSSSSIIDISPTKYQTRSEVQKSSVKSNTPKNSSTLTTPSSCSSEKDKSSSPAVRSVSQAQSPNASCDQNSKAQNFPSTFSNRESLTSSDDEQLQNENPSHSNSEGKRGRITREKNNKRIHLSSDDVPDDRSANVQENSEVTYSAVAAIDLSSNTDPSQGCTNGHGTSNIEESSSGNATNFQRTFPLPNCRNFYHTECADAPVGFLSDFAAQPNGFTRNIWVHLRDVRTCHVPSDIECHKCNETICFHAWIWGLCADCGSMYSPSFIKSVYSEVALISKEDLYCSSCVPKIRSKDRPQTRSTIGKLTPLIRLKLLLEDMNGNESFVSLNGDQANLFFGTNPSYNWIVNGTPENVKDITLNLLHTSLVRPILIELEKKVTLDGSDILRIRNTEVIETM